VLPLESEKEKIVKVLQYIEAIHEQAEHLMASANLLSMLLRVASSSLQLKCEKRTNSCPNNG
jgi:hypothetical protein